MLEKSLKFSFEKIKRNYNLPHDYIVSKFFEFGQAPSHNKYNDTYQCGCPICREGKSFGKKRRCFYLPDKNDIYCHNCGIHWSPYQWITQLSGMSYFEIQEEISENQFDSVDVSDLLESKEVVHKDASLPEDSINLFDPIQLVYWRSNEYVMGINEYLKSRRLHVAKNRPDALYVSVTDYNFKNRLIIPFKDVNGKIIFFQCRKVFNWDQKPDYISKTNADKSIFGIEKVDDSCDSVFIFEGPFDSFFVNNGIAVAGITKRGHSFTPLQEEQLNSLKSYKKIWCLDSQWKDQTAREKSEALLNAGESVFIWPEKYGTQFKDLNEMCIKYKLNEVSPKFIKDNTFIGMAGVFRLRKMGKIL